MTRNTTLTVQRAVRRVRLLALALLCISTVAACSGRPAGHPANEPWDPYEDANRSIHAFNKGLDRNVIRPVSHVYSGLLGDEVENAISRFSDNLSMPGAIVNNVLQGNMKGATEDTYRFIVNTTIGLLGFFDPATEFNMPDATQADFGETLFVWGVREGAYIELPFFGPSTERETVGLVVDFFLNPLDYWIRDPVEYYTAGARVSDILSTRQRFLRTIDGVLYESADSYLENRSIYFQNRQFVLGRQDADDYLDPYDDPYLELPE